MSFIKRITVLSGGHEQPVVNEEIYKKKRKRRTSRLLRPIERMQRRTLEALKVFGNELSERNDRSARKKKKNRWLLEAPANVVKSRNKARKKARAEVKKIF